jgi:hypothetical protein
MRPRDGAAAEGAPHAHGRLLLAAAAAGSFTLGALGEGWRPMDPLGADRSWYHPGLSATIYADASGAER